MEKCPCCERELRSFRDFPRLYIEKFERRDISKDIVLGMPAKLYVDKKLPWRLRREVIRDKEVGILPKEVLKLFEKEPNKEIVLHNGFVYLKNKKSREDWPQTSFYCYADMTDIARKALDSESIRLGLTELEKLVWKEIKTEDLLQLKDEIANVEVDRCFVYLLVGLAYQGHSGINGSDVLLVSHRGNNPNAYFDHTIGRLHYEGRINNPETAESRKI